MPDSSMPTGASDDAIYGEHRHIFALRWGDMDILQHVNNTVYFRAMEEARIHIFAPMQNLFPAGTGIVLARAECDFLKPMTWPANIEVVHQPVRLGRSSLDCSVLVRREGEPDTVYARARSVIVLSHLKTGTSCAWPAPVRAALEKQFAAIPSPAGTTA